MKLYEHQKTNRQDLRGHRKELSNERTKEVSQMRRRARESCNVVCRWQKRLHKGGRTLYSMRQKCRKKNWTGSGQGVEQIEVRR